MPNKLVLSILVILLFVVKSAYAENYTIQFSSGKLIVGEEKKLSVVNFLFKNQRPKLQVFTIEDPCRLVIDIYSDVKFDKNLYKLDGLLFNKVRIGGHSSKVRIVLDVIANALPEFTQTVTENSLSLFFESGDIQVEPSLETNAIKEAPKLVEKKLPKTEKVSITETIPEKAKQFKIAGSDKKPIDSIKNPSPNFSNRKEAFTIVDGKLKVVDIVTEGSLSRMGRDSVNIVPDVAKNQFDERKIDERKIAKTKRRNAAILRRKIQKTTVKAGRNSKDNSNGMQNQQDPSVAIQALLGKSEKDSSLSVWDLTITVFGLLLVILLYHYSKPTRPEQRFVGAELPEDHNLQEYYQTLGCSQDSTNKDIKERYKYLARVYHSDGLESKAIPNEVKRLSEDQFKKVNEAYKALKEVRGF